MVKFKNRQSPEKKSFKNRVIWATAGLCSSVSHRPLTLTKKRLMSNSTLTVIILVKYRQGAPGD